MEHFINSDRQAEVLWKHIREKLGITCPKCKKITPHYYNEKRKSWRCCCCKKAETGLKARTVLHKSKLPLRVYLRLLLELSENPGQYSIKKLQEKIKHTSYEPIWRFFHKVGGVLCLSQQSEFEKQKGELLVIEDMKCLMDYLGTFDHQKVIKQDHNYREMETNIKAMAISLDGENLDLNTCRYVIDKLPETWKSYSNEDIKDLLKRGAKHPTLVQKALKYWERESTPKVVSNSNNICALGPILKGKVMELLTTIFNVHRKADGDYLNSFMAHHSLKDRTKLKNKGSDFSHYIFTNCTTRRWFDCGDFVPPHLERLGYIKLCAA